MLDATDHVSNYLQSQPFQRLVDIKNDGILLVSAADAQRKTDRLRSDRPAQPHNRLHMTAQKTPHEAAAELQPLLAGWQASSFVAQWVAVLIVLVQIGHRPLVRKEFLSRGGRIFEKLPEVAHYILAEGIVSVSDLGAVDQCGSFSNLGERRRSSCSKFFCLVKAFVVDATSLRRFKARVTRHLVDRGHRFRRQLRRPRVDECAVVAI